MYSATQSCKILCITTDSLYIICSYDMFLWSAHFVFQASIVHKLLHEGQKVVHSLTFHPTETYLLTAAADKIYFWGVNQSSEDGWWLAVYTESS